MVTQKQKQTVMQETAEVIQSALAALGCDAPVTLIGQGTKLVIGVSSNNLTIQYANNTWVVAEYNPNLKYIRSYHSLEGCLRDIVMREPSLIFAQKERAVGE